MTKHKAKPEVWAAVERWCKNEMDMLNCTLELRARVEELEAAAESNCQEMLDSSLVERVAGSLTTGRHSDARAAIHAAADWLDQQELHVAATRLRQEVE